MLKPLALPSLLASAIAAASLAGAALFLGSPAEGADAANASAQRIASASDLGGCPDTIPMAPVVMMTTAGYTLAGSTLSTVTVYSNGLVTTSAASGATGGASAQQTMTDPVAVARLASELRAVGAFRACDQSVQVSDLPLTTMTVFRSGPAARSHSFSFWIAEGDASLAEDVVLDFIAAQVLPE